MPKRRKPAATAGTGLQLDRWDFIGSAGFLLGAVGLLALIGQINREGFVVAALGAAAAALAGRAAPVSVVVAMLLGGVLLASGARRRPLLRLWHLGAGLLFVVALAALADLAAPGDVQPPAGGWAGRLVGDGLRQSVGLGPAYALLAIAAVATLAYGLTATPWGLAAIGVLGRVVIRATSITTRTLHRIVVLANQRAAPLFHPSAAAADSSAPAAPDPPHEAEASPASSESTEEWRQEPLIRTTEPATVEVEPPRSDGPWTLPPLRLLKHAKRVTPVPADEIRAKAAVIEDALASFSIQATVAEAIPGPVVTQYLLRPGSGVKVARITALASDLALKLAAKSIRIEAPVPGRPYVGIETPNDAPSVVTVREVMESEAWASSDAHIRLALGKDVAGEVRIVDLSSMPHLLIAGATGAGKSACLTALLTCLLYQLTPDELQLVLIDPKMVELVSFEGMPHLRMPVITNVEEVLPVLTWVSTEMARRYRLLNRAGVRNLKGYNAQPTEATGGKPLPYIVVVIDELADVMMTAPGDVERVLARLAQMARATGIHLMVSTQRPSVDVLTGLIKANFPTRISFMVSSQADSRTILDSVGAERLIGRGDMLYSPPEGGKPSRIQGAYAGDDEIRAVVEHWRQQGQPEMLTGPELRAAAEPVENEDDELFVEATELVMRHNSITPDLLSRELRIGRTLALKLAHRLETEGFVGPPEAQSLRRPVLQRDPAE